MCICRARMQFAIRRSNTSAAVLALDAASCVDAQRSRRARTVGDALGRVAARVHRCWRLFWPSTTSATTTTRDFQRAHRNAALVATLAPTHPHSTLRSAARRILRVDVTSRRVSRQVNIFGRRRKLIFDFIGFFISISLFIKEKKRKKKKKKKKKKKIKERI